MRTLELLAVEMTPGADFACNTGDGAAGGAGAGDLFGARVRRRSRGEIGVRAGPIGDGSGVRAGDGGGKGLGLARDD